MKSRLSSVMIIIIGLISLPAKAQHVYPVTSGEILFSQSNASLTQDFISQYPDARIAADNVRFTCFFHLAEYFHMDLNNNIGIFTGIGVRNIGMITDETLPQTVSATGVEVPYVDYNIVRRQYTLGIPLALKLGSFKSHFYLFGGGEYEMAFHFKEKYWTDSFDRSGSKTKDTQWFGSQTPTFIPSVFAGIQFPGGINVKFRYYLQNFLNHDYKVTSNSQAGSTYNVSDLSRYESTQLISFSLCWQFNTAYLWNGDDDL